MTAIERHRKSWPGKSDEWLFERLSNELSDKVKEIHRLLDENRSLLREMWCLSKNTVAAPIRVMVKLKSTQNLGFEQWRCSINGDDKIVTNQYVDWYCTSIEDAFKSFDWNQVEEFNIVGSTDPGVFTLHSKQTIAQ